MVSNPKDEEIERLRSILRKAHDPRLPLAQKVIRGLKRRLRRRKKKQQIKKAAKKDLG